MAPPPPPSRSATGANKESSKNTERNEYIPSFIAKKPFYIDDSTASDADYLQHQRLASEQKHSDPIATSQWYDRAQSKKKPAATKFRKGACENCGAMGHKAKDCLQRRRKTGARWTGKAIAADEEGKEINLGWDAKRDRWNGYNASEYAEVVREYEEMEQLKKEVAAEKNGGTGDDDDEGGAGDKYEAETDMGRNQATSTRNLRLREDKAKYLLDLNPESARYDPKTRTMVDGTGSTSNTELLAEEGFQKASGDAAEFERAQRYAWETQQRGGPDVLHLQANPTEGEIARKRKAIDDLRSDEERRKKLLEAYGDQSAVRAKPKVTAASETFLEYDEKGRVKGAPEQKEKSMYPEDVMINNHTSVWGSWWKDFKWGYACCHSTIKQSFCTGLAGIEAAEESEAFRTGKFLVSAEEGRTEEDGGESEKVADGTSRMEGGMKAIGAGGMEESRRRLEELKAGVDPEEMERYRREKASRDDPMANVDHDRLLEAS